MTLKLIFWSSHLDIQFDRLLPAHLAHTLDIHHAGSFARLEELLEQYPDVRMILTSLRPSDLEALYQVQKLQRARPDLALVALFDTTTEITSLTRGLELLLGRLNRQQPASPSPSADLAEAVSIRDRRQRKREPEETPIKLTPRQMDVLQLIIEGQSNKQIARELDLCEGTVKIHCMAIFRELGVTNRTQAAIRGEQMMGELKATA